MIFTSPVFAALGPGWREGFSQGKGFPLQLWGLSLQRNKKKANLTELYLTVTSNRGCYPHTPGRRKTTETLPPSDWPAGMSVISL